MLTGSSTHAVAWLGEDRWVKSGECCGPDFGSHTEEAT
jgi:hypothetical protein